MIYIRKIIFKPCMNGWKQHIAFRFLTEQYKATAVVINLLANGPPIS
jgi:hypothetical protein